ncbi:hypothetical protein HDV00_009932 [Rhizophlyctis rosea]|nr:hypothetical protein HDV00_009932 [Rhizophlyctis rosea]
MEDPAQSSVWIKMTRWGGAYRPLEDDPDKIVTAPHQDDDTPISHERPGPSPRNPTPSQITPRLLLLSSFAALNGFLAGYDTGIISGATLYVREAFQLSDVQTEFVVSSVTLGAILGSLLSTHLTDTQGRRLTILLASLIFTLGALLMSLAPTYHYLLLGRTIAGTAIGMGSAVPIYIAELSPPNIRGQIVNLTPFLITLGQFVSYLVAWGLSGSGNWRAMFGIAAVPSVVQFLVGVRYLPESPRFLVASGKKREAVGVLRGVRGVGMDGEDDEDVVDDVRKEVDAISASIESTEKEVSFWEMFRVTGYRKCVVIAAGLHVLQQFSG